MTARHTPGPWTEHGDFKEIHPADDEDGLVIIADMDPDNSMPSHTRIANARLIAAAPDLLEAAEMLIADLGSARCKNLDPEISSDKPVIALLAAIARAKGAV